MSKETKAAEKDLDARTFHLERFYTFHIEDPESHVVLIYHGNTAELFARWSIGGGLQAVEDDRALLGETPNVLTKEEVIRLSLAASKWLYG